MRAAFVVGRKNDEQGWAKSKIEDSKRKTKPAALVCAGCVDRGFTPKDLQTYTCEGCDAKQGRHKFHEVDIKNKSHRKTDILFCPACKDKEHRLLELVKSRKAWRCTCGNKRVQRKCMASCQLYPDRCRGCNLGVRSEDIKFLQKRFSNQLSLN
jgi:hypothetical protein